MINNMMFNFNQKGMNNPIMGMYNQQNQMNGMMMDKTAQNLKNIIQPYENRIRELEEIIKQKDFEILVLKQKLNNNNLNNNNMNSMMINMNMNPMDVMMGNMNQQMKYKGKEISLKIILGNNIESIKCFIHDKASIIEEKYKLNEGCLTFNYKPINDELTIGENGFFNDSFIYVKYNIINITFENSQGLYFPICLSDDCPLDIALINYLMRIGRLEDRINRAIIFLYNACELKIGDKTPIKEIFSGSPNPRVVVQMR